MPGKGAGSFPAFSRKSGAKSFSMAKRRGRFAKGFSAAGRGCTSLRTSVRRGCAPNGCAGLGGGRIAQNNTNFIKKTTTENPPPCGTISTVRESPKAASEQENIARRRTILCNCCVKAACQPARLPALLFLALAQNRRAAGAEQFWPKSLCPECPGKGARNTGCISKSFPGCYGANLLARTNVFLSGGSQTGMIHSIKKGDVHLCERSFP